MLGHVTYAFAVILALVAGRPEAERMHPLATAVADAHRHSIALAGEAAALPVSQLSLPGDDEHEVYVALVDAELALGLIADERPPVLERTGVIALRRELGLAREALADYAAARTDANRVDMREAAEGLRDALGRAGAVIDAALEAPPSR